MDKVLLWLSILVLLPHRTYSGTLPPPFTGKCLADDPPVFPPKPEVPIKTYVIQLDRPPSERWVSLVTAYRQEMVDLTEALKNASTFIMKGKLVNFIDKYLSIWIDKIPAPYAEELIGISNATGIPLGEVILYNVVYELSAACTSVVAQNDQGDIYAARNLDFGFLLGWDAHEHQWILTKLLRKLVVNLEWRFQEKLIFKSTNFAGFIGVLTAVKADSFSLTINERFDWHSGIEGILKWILNLEKSKWVTWMSREVMTKAGTYDEAVFSLSIVRLMAPVYFIVGGTETGQGVVITRSRERTLDVRSMNQNSTNWYLLQTNYDPWVSPLTVDDRRTPGKLCMEQLGKSRVTFSGLYSVLASKPILNKLTVYTSLLFPKMGSLETYIQKCDDPCWFV